MEVKLMKGTAVTRTHYKIESGNQPWPVLQGISLFYRNRKHIQMIYVKNHIKVIRHFSYYSSYNTVVYLSYKKTLHGDIYVQIGAIDNMILHETSETIVLS